MQPRSRTTCVGWIARLKGTDAIHAVCLLQDHPATEVEESSVKLENQSADSRHGHILLHWVFQRLKIQFEDKYLPYPFSFLVFASAFVRVSIIACPLLWLVSAKRTLPERRFFFCLLKKPSCLFFLWTTKHNLSLNCLSGSCSSKECSSGSFESTFAFSFSSAFPSPHLAALEWSGLPRTLVVVACPKNTISHHQCNIAHQLLRLWPVVHIRLQHNFYDEGSVRAASVSVLGGRILR